ncbi:MAG: nucleotidyltransferase family protein [Deferrisomatales bacterium]
MIDLPDAHLAEVRHILATLVPDLEVRAFGSRVAGTARKHSDLDLALVGADRVDWRTIEALKDAFSESDLPFSVDVIDWSAAPASFRLAVGERYERLQ